MTLDRAFLRRPHLDDANRIDWVSDKAPRHCNPVGANPP